MSSRSVKAMCVAGVCAAGAAAVYVAAFRVHGTAVVDDRGFSGFRGLWQFRTLGGGRWAADIVAPVPYAVAAVAVPAVALGRRRPRTALAAVAVIAGANLTTQLLKRLTDGIERPAAYYETLWPSGHATAVLALATAIVIVTPLRFRSFAVGLGSAASIAIVYGVMISGMHHPSDVLGAAFVTGMWSALAWMVHPAEPVSLRQPLLIAAPTAAVLIAVPFSIVLLRERARDVVDYASAHNGFALSAAAIAVAIVALLAATGVAHSAD